MATPRRKNDPIERLRDWRVKPDRAAPLAAFLPAVFKSEVERQYKQLVGVADAWNTHVPPAIAEHTHLVSLQRGVLLVGVDSSARLYELDRLLRGGLENEIITSSRGAAIRQIKLAVRKPPASPPDANASRDS